MVLSAPLGLQVTGRGVSARKAVQKGDVLLFVPDEYMIALPAVNSTVERAMKEHGERETNRNK